MKELGTGDAGHQDASHRDRFDQGPVEMIEALSKRPMDRRSIGENGIAGLLADHVDRGDDEETGDAGKHGGVDDTEVLSPIDAEVTIHDGHRV